MMAAAITSSREVKSSAVRMAWIAGVFYLINIVTAMYSYFGPRSRPAFYAGLVATVGYIVMTVLFYFLFGPVNRYLSFLAACVSVAGSAVGWHLPPLKIYPLAFFLLYCLLIGYLILRSTFVPRFWVS